MTKLTILTIVTTMLVLTACSKEYNSNLQKQMDETKIKSDQIQSKSIQAKEIPPSESTPPRTAQTILEETPIPISDSSDKGTYFLINKEQTHNGFKIVYKRVGVAQTTFSKYEINCKTRKMRVLGEGVESANNIHDYPEKGDWFTPVTEASTEDAFKFVCDNN